MKLTYNDVLDILRIVDEMGEQGEVELELADLHVHVVKGALGAAPLAVPRAGSPAAGATPTAPTAGVTVTPPPAGRDLAAARPAGGVDGWAGGTAAPAGPAAARPGHFVAIEAPMVGTFYRAPGPGKPPFVEVGQSVAPDDTVCIIEVMKLFNSIKAGCHGRVVEVCAENGAVVQAGQALMWIEPTAAAGPA